MTVSRNYFAKRLAKQLGIPYTEALRRVRDGSFATPTLTDTHPHLFGQIHPSLNGDLDVGALTAGSNRRIWWRCAEGPDHIWQTSVANRAGAGTGCPCCAGKKASVTNSLATRYPDIAIQLDDELNDGLTADQLVAQSNKRVWWRCPAGPDHTWQTAVANRTHSGTGCPYCAGQRASITNSLARLFPDVAAQLDLRLNDGLTANELPSRSARRVWWRCAKGPDHSWQTTVASRTSARTGCPCCTGQQVSVTNSLATHYPDVAAQLASDLNDGLTADQIVGRSAQKVWWRCHIDPKHVWQAAVASRTSSATGCPYCAGQRVSSTNSLATKHPDVAAQLDSDRNGGLTADQVTAGSNRKLWWRCPKGPDHMWKATVVDRTTGSGCPCCAGYQLSITNSLAAKYPEVAAQLDPELNEGITAEQVVWASSRRLWWRCSAGPDHLWLSMISKRTSAKRGCPYCAGRKVSLTNSLATRFPQLAAQLDPDLNEGLTADLVVAGSAKRLWWRCPKGPDHVWQATADQRTQVGTGCPSCSGQQASVTNSLAACFPEIAAQLDRTLNDGLTPDRLPSGSERRVWWRCPEAFDHVWRTSVALRTRAGTDCPTCATSGYRPSLPGYLYLLERGGERKIGISNVPAIRLATHRRNGWDLIELSPAMDGATAHRLEKDFLLILTTKGLRRARTLGGGLRYDGYTETWTHSDLPIDSLDDVYAAVGRTPDLPGGA